MLHHSFVRRQLILLMMAQSAVQFILMAATRPTPSHPNSLSLSVQSSLESQFQQTWFSIACIVGSIDLQDCSLRLLVACHCIHSFLWINEIDSNIVRFVVEQTNVFACSPRLGLVSFALPIGKSQLQPTDGATHTLCLPLSLSTISFSLDVGSQLDWVCLCPRQTYCYKYWSYQQQFYIIYWNT